MSPNTVPKDYVQTEGLKPTSEANSVAHDKPFRAEYVWRNIILMTLLHISGVYGLYLIVMRAKMMTIFYVYVLGLMSSMGVQSGAHRLWSHRSYKAKLHLRVILAFFHIMSFQNDIYEWCRDHRVHHKYAETDADPHNAKRGFFFSHVGWLLVRKHPEVKEKGKNVDLNDLMADPVVRFQRKYYKQLLVLIYAVIPTIIPYYFWSESLLVSYFGCVMFRHCLTLNITWCVNSAAHIWGYRPYDKNIDAREATIRHVLMGEGFHNYHHTFPWDYSASELGAVDVFNPATAFIDLFALLGWAYDRKVVPKHMIEKKQSRSGDVNDIQPVVSRLHRSVYEWVTGIMVFLSPLFMLFVFKTIMAFF